MPFLFLSLSPSHIQSFALPLLLMASGQYWQNYVWREYQGADCCHLPLAPDTQNSNRAAFRIRLIPLHQQQQQQQLVFCSVWLSLSLSHSEPNYLAHLRPILPAEIYQFRAIYCCCCCLCCLSSISVSERKVFCFLSTREAFAPWINRVKSSQSLAGQSSDAAAAADADAGSQS